MELAEFHLAALAPLAWPTVIMQLTETLAYNIAMTR